MPGREERRSFQIVVVIHIVSPFPSMKCALPQEYPESANETIERPHAIVSSL